MVTAVALSASLLAPSPGLGQPTQSERARATAAEPRLKALLEAQARQLTVFDREGNVVNTIGERDTYSQPVFSPDRTRVAVLKRAQTWDFWVLDVATGNGTQMTSSHERERVKAPVWSPDGSQIAYVVVRGGHDNLYRRASNGEGEEELLYQHAGGEITLTDWSLDGRFLSFFRRTFPDQRCLFSLLTPMAKLLRWSARSPRSWRHACPRTAGFLPTARMKPEDPRSSSAR